MPKTRSERIIPDETEQGIISAHLKRYVFAHPFCRSKRVLDIACGAGYGSCYLSDFAKQVVGVDRSEEAIDYARRRYERPNVAFRVMDACALSFQDEAFDVVCSFETIEHLRDVDAYLQGVRRVLTSDGTYVVSTPCAKRTTQTPKNQFHYQEWTPCDFERLLLQHFGSVRLSGQKRRQTALHRWLQKADVFNLRTKIHSPLLTKSLSRAVGTVPFVEMSLEDMEIIENDFRNALWIIGVCTNPKKLSHLKQ